MVVLIRKHIDGRHVRAGKLKEMAGIFKRKVAKCCIPKSADFSRTETINADASILGGKLGHFTTLI